MTIHRADQRGIPLLVSARIRVSGAATLIVAVWVCLRLLLLVFAALVSQVRPFTALEQQVSVWPPAAPQARWLERVLLAPWNRWDASYYVRIVERGYRLDDGTAQFHPLLPWLATLLSWITGNALLALLMVSSVSGLLFVLAFERLARLDRSAAEARYSALLLLGWPLSFVLFVPYTEPLFLLLAVLCFWWARNRRWWLAAAFAALAVLTRQQGVFLLLPLAWELWETSGRSWRGVGAAWRHWLSLALIPGAMLLWLAYRAVALDDLNTSGLSVHDLLYTVMISPSSSKVVPVQSFLLPWHALGLALGKMWRAPELSLGVDLVLAGVFLILAVLAWPCLRTSDRIYVVVIVIVSFSYHTGPFYPYMGLPRHLLLAFPVFIGLGPVVGRPIARILALVSGALGFLFLLLLYLLEAWTP